MTKPFEKRNQTDTARRKLRSLAKASSLDVEFVSALANFTWDYDSVFRNEPIGWVNNVTLSNAAKVQLRLIAQIVELDSEFKLGRDQATEDLIQAHAKKSTNCVWSNFYDAAVNKNYGRVSEFASHHYLRGLNESRVNLLHWDTKPIGMVEIARNLFLKLFRGGSVDRYDLAYLWCDLNIPLRYGDTMPPNSAWLDQLLSAIESLPAKSGLKDILGCCKGLVGGDKFFKQEVLQSLAYADVLRVNGLQVSDMFIAERRNELSPHFYSNEWSYPLRFWSTNGGYVNRKAIPVDKTAL